jgi:hypothetical protein
MAKLKARRTDPTVIKAAAIREAFDSIAEEEPIKYAVGTMQPIDPAYAKTTFEEGDRVKNQLDKALNIGISKVDVTGEICTKWNERESTWRKSGSCPSRGTNQSKS